MPDIATIWDPESGVGDWALSVPRLNLLVDELGNSVLDQDDGPIWTDIEPYTAGTGLVSGGDLVTAVLISCFTDAAADPDDVIPDGTADPRGWWGGAIGCKFWLRERSKNTPTVIALVENDFAEALQWLIDDGVASSIDISAQVPRAGMLAVTIQISRGRRVINLKFEWAWSD